MTVDPQPALFDATVTELVRCPVCKGRGEREPGLPCVRCQGTGKVAPYDPQTAEIPY